MTDRPGLPTGPTDDADPIELVVPAHAAYATTARLVAASVGADIGFSIDDIDDLRLAISEVFNAVVDRVPAATRVRVGYRGADGELVVTLDVADTDAVIELDELGVAIVTAAADHVRFEPRRVTLTKRATVLARGDG
jgi:serine/threonine-protein kinase RsbW